MIDDNLIIQQLEKILESPSFKASSLLSKFLSYVVEQTLAGNQKNIKAYNIAVEAFGRKPNFDPQKDTIVRIYAGKLRKELTAYYARPEVADSIKITIPKGSYQPEFEVINSTNSKVPKPFWSSRFKRLYVWSFVFLIAFAGFMLFNFLPKNKMSNNKPAILFFEIKNISSKPENDVLAQGITEEIVLLSSRFSEIDFYGPLKQGKEKIDLNRFDNDNYLFALNGNLKKSDNLFILNVILTNYRSGKVLWTKSYKKPIKAESLIEIEYEVCNDISAKIGSIYGVVQNEIITNTSHSNPSILSSHKSILQYYRYLRILTYDEFLLTKKALIQTIQDDPGYGIAWSALAALFIDEYLYYGGDSLESFTIGHKYINQALKLDPNNVLVQNNRVYIAFLSRQMDDFKQAVSKVQSLNPSNIMNGENGLYLVYSGESQRGLDMIRQAQKHAINYPGYFHLGPFLDYYRKGEYKKALFEANQIKMPKYYPDPLCRAVALVNLDRMDKAVKAKKELLSLVPDFDRKGKKILSKGNIKQKDIDAILKDLSKINIEADY